MAKLAYIMSSVLVVIALAMLASADDIDQYIKDLHDENVAVRLLAIGALMDINDTRAVEPVIQALKDENATVRLAAAECLFYFKDARAVEPMIQALKDENSDVRLYALVTLSIFNDSRAVDPVIQALKDESSDIREYAAIALGSFNDPRAVSPLIDALKDDDSRVIYRAARSLLSIGDYEAIDPLIQGLKMRGRRETITVGPSGNDYTSIQEAIGAADDGDIIEVQGGTYHENVNLNKRVALFGTGNPVVDAGGKGSAITISAVEAILDGFSVTNVEDCGINVTLGENIISSNVASGLEDAPGIMLYSSDGNIVINNTANDCLEGFELYRSNSNELLSNTVSHSQTGITVVDSYRNVVRRNILDDNALYSIGLAVYEPPSSEDLRKPIGNEISDNTVSGSENGILLLGSSENVILNNTVRQNQYGITLIANGGFNSAGNIIYKNHLADNQKNAFDEINETMAAVGAGPNRWDDGSAGNYYGDFKCVDVNSDDICDSQYDIPGGMSIDRYPLASPISEKVYRSQKTLPNAREQSRSTQQMSEPSDPANRLNTLRDLLDAGLITQEDYDAKKAEILAGL